MGRSHRALVVLCVAVLGVGVGAVALSMALPATNCWPAWVGGACASNAGLRTAIAIVGGALVLVDVVAYVLARHLDDDPTAD